MSKAIERRMTLKDQVTPTMSKINKSTLKYAKNKRDLHKQAQKTWFGIKRGMLGVVATSAALLGSIMAMKKLEEAYKAQSLAETKLQAVFAATGRATDEQIQGLIEYANTIQDVGVVGNETAIAGMQQLATFNVTSDTIETLTEGMLDLVAQTKGLEATQQDMVDVGNKVGKVMSGQVGALSKAGISFTKAQEKVLKFGTEEERAATLAKVLAQNVGGVNKALAATPEGRWKQMNNSIGDMQKKVGKVIVQIKGQLAAAFMEHLPQIEAGIDKITVSIMQWVDSGGVERFIDTLEITIDTTKQLAPVIVGLTGAFVTYKLATIAATISTKAFTAAIMANPIGFAIGLMVSLITVIVLVRKNKDLLRLKFMETWNAIAAYTESGINTMIGGANSLLSTFEYTVISIKFFFHDMWNDVITMAENGVNKMAAPLNAVLGALGKEEIGVSFSGKKSSMEKPAWEKKEFFGEVEFKRFSDDSIASIKDSRAKKQEKEIEQQTKALGALAEAVEENTSATNKNTSAMSKGSSSDMTAETIADTLLPRLERVVYG
ncbi:hypothetical protein SAMN05446037_100169 [Anaerovirgula multivorans]|uniref:Phage tail tape measure protein, TP901 family, core region n=1 Tax=Anaerovirgula multivorans TaxID=312168 RepID=A0A238ZRW7_9FIRM|nr:hypothetical protein [Anaerovirgula multivorans]SNR86080.1 hypothetical protein SAMN05446037_100169 [Anaerovirgula multivorans]